MRTSWRITAVVLAVAAASACGGGTSSTGNGTGAGSDASRSSNDAGPMGTECYSPADCPSTKPICCGTIGLGQMGTACELFGVLSTCATSCAISEQPLACPVTQTAELCSAASDCTDPSYPKCCSVGYAGGGPGRTATFCVSASNAATLQGGGASCL